MHGDHHQFIMWAEDIPGLLLLSWAQMPNLIPRSGLPHHLYLESRYPKPAKLYQGSREDHVSHQPAPFTILLAAPSVSKDRALETSNVVGASWIGMLLKTKAGAVKLPGGGGLGGCLPPWGSEAGIHHQHRLQCCWCCEATLLPTCITGQVCYLRACNTGMMC